MEEKFRIRELRKQDKEEVVQVCISAGSQEFRENDMLQSAMVEVFCNYYVEHETQDCFVAVNEKDHVIGYILCAPDYQRWVSKFSQAYLENSVNPIVPHIGKESIRILEAHSEEYPAHLHIDLLPEAQGQGLGKKLLKKLIEHLSELEVKGLLLNVSLENEGAIRFYERFGFKELQRGEHEIVMGIKVNKKPNQVDRIYPGKVWFDTSGKRIQAHGGSMFYEEGIYYWYGENKERTDGKNGIWHWGVRCYSSRDLCNWEDLGNIIEPELQDETSSLHPSSCMDRPHIIYNKKTKKYVCWLKIMNKDGSQSETVLTADRFLGPYTKVKEGLRPLNTSAGDFDLAVADDGKAYYYFERVHSETICADLTEDYTDVTGYYSTHFPHKCPPHVREATAHFQRDHLHYLITSGTSGYFPNPSQVAVGKSWHGPFTVLGDPHPEDKSKTSYHSQISCVFKVQGKKDLYIAMADRWLPEQSFLDYMDYADNFEAIFNKDLIHDKQWSQVRKKVDAFNEAHNMQVTFSPECKDNTSIADYVWLPLRFVEANEQYPMGMVFIDWKDEWSPNDYEEEING